MWKRISSLARFTKKVNSAQNIREKTGENLERDLVNSKKEIILLVISRATVFCAA